MASSAAFRVRRDPSVGCGGARGGVSALPRPQRPGCGSRPRGGGRRAARSGRTSPGPAGTRTPPRGCATSGHVSAGRMTGGSRATAACPPPGARPAAPRPALLLLLSRGQGPRGPLCDLGGQRAAQRVPERRLRHRGGAGDGTDTVVGTPGTPQAACGAARRQGGGREGRQRFPPGLRGGSRWHLRKMTLNPQQTVGH